MYSDMGEALGRAHAQHEHRATLDELRRRHAAETSGNMAGLVAATVAAVHEALLAGQHTGLGARGYYYYIMIVWLVKQ